MFSVTQKRLDVLRSSEVFEPNSLMILDTILVLTIVNAVVNNNNSNNYYYLNMQGCNRLYKMWHRNPRNLQSIKNMLLEAKKKALKCNI